MERIEDLDDSSLLALPKTLTLIYYYTSHALEKVLLQMLITELHRCFLSLIQLFDVGADLGLVVGVVVVVHC